MPLFEPTTDREFHEWREAHPNGFVLNFYVRPTPDYIVLHRARCGLWRGKENYAGGDYPKRCSTDRAALVDWAREWIKGQPKACGLCKP